LKEEEQREEKKKYKKKEQLKSISNSFSIQTQIRNSKRRRFELS
jgi:hypothetical protein